MVKIDFTCFGGFSACPTWWRNLVSHLQEPYMTMAGMNEKIQKELTKFNGKLIEDDYSDVQELHFETDSDYSACKLYWMIYGK